MNYDKVQGIGAGMRRVLTEQTLVTTNPVRITLAETSQPQIDAYQARNDSLRELGEELSNLDARILRAYRFRSAWLIRIVPPHTNISSWFASRWRLGAAVAHAVRIAVMSTRSIETEETRAERAQRTKEEGEEVRSIADKISNYARSVHRRYPSGEVVVGENDLAAQLRKRRDRVGSALNLLLREQKVKKASLCGYWKLNV